MTSLHRTFGQLSDPRYNRKKQHLLIDIVVLSILAVLSGAESWDSQCGIAEKIIDKGGDYILSVKNNQKTLFEEVEATCNRHRPVFDITETEKGHGRIETRRCQVFEKGDIVDFDNQWKGLDTVIKISSTREIKDKITTEERFFISSAGTNQAYNQYIRSHWGVENKLHWTLDMVFREDQQRKRDKMAAENFAVVRKIALNLLRKDTASKATLIRKSEKYFQKASEAVI